MGESLKLFLISISESLKKYLNFAITFATLRKNQFRTELALKRNISSQKTMLRFWLSFTLG